MMVDEQRLLADTIAQNSDRQATVGDRPDVVTGSALRETALYGCVSGALFKTVGRSRGQ